MSLCDKCGKAEAVTTFQQTVKGEKTSMKLCEGCAKDSMPLASVLGMFSGLANSVGLASNKGENPVVCQKCGTTSLEFQSQGYVGCSECYTAFSSIIDKMAIIEPEEDDSDIFDVSDDESKPAEPVKPSEPPVVVDEKEYVITQLKEKLESVVECENYEEAAVIRDKIAEMEKE
jgi:protein arginine kinase activator